VNKFKQTFQKINSVFLTLGTLAIIFAQTTEAAKSKSSSGGSKGEFRVFGGTQEPKLEQVNSELKAVNLEPMESLVTLGAEAIVPLFWRVSFGFRFIGKTVESEDVSGNVQNELDKNYAYLHQVNAIGLLRFRLVDKTYFKADIFGGAGLAKTKLRIRAEDDTDGHYTRGYRSENRTGLSTAGGSLAVGFGNVFLFIEAGHEWQNVRLLDKTGTLNTNITKLEMDGPYYFAGLAFDGIPDLPKMK
jgi:hypothetical protein